MKKSFWKKMSMMALAICLCLSCLSIAPAYAEESDTLNDTMEYLVEECGPRLYGTPNEDKAAAYMKAQFESFGYTDVEWAKPALSSTSYVGQLTFSDGIADIYGNCYPNNPTNGTFDKIEAPLVNVDTAEAVVLPEGVTGEIIAVATFSGSLNIDLVNGVVDQIKAANAEVTVKGLLLAKKDSIKVTSPGKADRDAMNKSAIPCVVTTQYFLDKALANADKLIAMEQCTRTNTNAVIATKPAATDDPDAIIIVTAHLDSVIAAPGASDNATGSAALIELAKKFSTVDNGNIKLIFGSVGAEEGGGMLGSMYIINNLTDEEKAVAINMNMDMLGAIQPAYGGAPLNAVSMDIYCGKNPLALNLPAFLVTDGAANITWAEGIENVRIFKYGASDHQKFQQAGIDAASMIIVTDEDDDIETINHSSADTLENNYSYERLQMCTSLIANGIQKAIDNQLSKKAEILFTQTAEGWTAALTNSEQLFKLYDKVTVTLTEQAAPAAEGEEAAEPNVVELTFTADALSQTVSVDPTACTVDSVATGSGISDNKNAERAEQYKIFQTALVSEVKSESEAAAAVEELIDAIGEVKLSKTEQIAAAIEAFEALTEEEQAAVDNLDTLVAAVEELLEQAAEVDAVNAAIAELTDESDKETILAVKKAYDALDDEQKALITDYAKLEAAVKAVSAPQTGDTTPVTLLCGMMIMSLLAAAALMLQTKKQKI